MDIACGHFKSIEFRTALRRDRGDIVSIGFGDHLSGHGRVFCDGHLGAKTLNDVGALSNRLLVRADLGNILKVCSWCNQELMVDLLSQALDDGNAVLRHKVIDLIDRTRRGVFDGKYAIFAKSALDGAKYAFERGEVRYDRDPEQAACCNLTICSLNALTCYVRGAGKGFR